jgi:hypothetical protein
MEALNLPTYSFKIKSVDGIDYIYDRFRKKFVKLTPEEWVRQNFANYLVEEKGYPASRFVIEKSLKLNKLSKRCDILYHNKKGDPEIMVECKAPSFNIGQKTFEQVSVYNIRFRVRYLIITNGIRHFCCRVNFDKGSVEFLNNIPVYTEVEQSLPD